MTKSYSENQRVKLTPKEGFDLVGIDFFSEYENRLYKIEHFDMYNDALTAKKSRKNPDEYLVLYRDASGECCYR